MIIGNYKMYLQRKSGLSFFLMLLFIFVLMQNVYADVMSLNDDARKLKSFVDSGINYIKKYGTKKAYAEFSNPQGRFIQKNPNLYLFVYNFKGDCLAHGFMSNRVGKNFLNEVDAYGTPTTKLATTVAKTGDGFFTLYWPEPGDNANKSHLKTIYIKRIDEKTFIGGGLYEALDVPRDQILVKLEEVKAFINTGVAYFKRYGAQAAYKEFNSPKGQFRVGDKYLFVLDSNGVVLADGSDPDKFVGKNLYNITDDFGTPYVQLLIQIAKGGGGSVSYYYPEPRTKKIKLKSSYIIPLTNNTYIGSGFYGD